jgi:NAD(P)-dependent dehydrogenase (short-subunit alcohol dehydrogenase family)
MKNKIIYLLGGQGLIGKEIAKKFKFDNKVIVLDINIKNEIKNNLIYQNFDVSKFYSMGNELNRIVRKNGNPDIFVNSSYPRTNDWNKYNIENLKINYLRKNVDLHMNSYAWSILEFAKIMKKNKIKGSIISINSIYGLLGQDENIYEKTNIKVNPVYSLIKGGLISFNKNVASYYGKYNIRINSIISGGIEGHVAGLRNSQSKSFKKNYIKKTLIKRMGKPQDIADAVYFLASEQSSYITGSDLVVDGGFTAI